MTDSSRMHPTAVSPAIYTVANDPFIEWVLPLIASTCYHNPDVPLVVIPFDERVERLRNVVRAWPQVSLFDDVECLRQLDAVGKRAMGNDLCGHFRRYAAFSGPAKTFAYIDADAIVLRSLATVLDTLPVRRERILFDAWHPDYCYRGELRQRMESAYPARGYNSGIFYSSHGAVTVEDLAAAASELARLGADLSGLYEQPVFNYVIDTMRIQAAALSDHDHIGTGWAGREIRKTGSDFIVDSPGAGDHGYPIFTLHWAGTARPSRRMPHRRLWLRYRKLARRQVRAFHRGSR